MSGGTSYIATIRHHISGSTSVVVVSNAEGLIKVDHTDHSHTIKSNNIMRTN